MDLKKDILDKAKNFLFDPKNAFDKEIKTDVISALKYGIVWLVIMSILSVILLTIFGEYLLSTMGNILPETAMTASTIGNPISTFLFSLVGGLFGLILGGLWLHIFAYIFGARMKLENTLKTVFYGNTPTYVLGWIPYVSLITMIWTLVLYALGLTRLQKLSTGRAVGAVLLAVLIPAIILGALVFVGPSLLSTTTMTMPNY